MCLNSVTFGNNNHQNIGCIGDELGVCTNFASFGNDNTQKIRCMFVTENCTNITFEGEGNNQNLVCVHSTDCTNESQFVEDNTQKSVCVYSGTCLNDGIDTQVISVRSDNCENDDASESTTICVNSRIINRPNS